MAIHSATASAPVNIACIKYWGKRDTKLILPTNSSLSVTLDQDHLRSTTSSAASADFEKDRLWLNGEEETIKTGSRIAVCIAALRGLREAEEAKDAELEKIAALPVHLVSYNNFPTAAGLASSASGLAALVASVAALYSLPTSASDLSVIARQGSGSACRSLFGGFVGWEMGSRSDGADSKAYEVAPREHWPEMQALILVVSDEKKSTASTAGMQLTVETSALLQHRLTQVPTYMANITRAIEQRDFAAFAEATMRDSNQFHAVCLDTFPPIFYLSDVSRAIVHVVSELNRTAGRPVAAYTFDAGPNAVLYALESDMPEIISLMAHYFPPALQFDDPFKLAAKPAPSARDGFKHGVSAVWEQGKVARFIHTRIGDGPRVLGAEESLLTAEGLPKTLKQ